MALPVLPLAGIRVANFGWVWAGPVVGQTLGFLGAEVYKIESRARIDLTRMLPPFGGGVRDPDRSLSNHACWAGGCPARASGRRTGPAMLSPNRAILRPTSPLSPLGASPPVSMRGGCQTSLKRNLSSRAPASHSEPAGAEFRQSSLKVNAP